jgi:hypothetical protein
MNNEQVIALLRRLSTDKEFYPEAVYPGVAMGLCDVLWRQCRRADLEVMLEDIAHGWPLYSGMKSFPVPCKGWAPTRAFLHVPKWEGEYGDNRRNLCGWFADYLEFNYEEPRS